MSIHLPTSILPAIVVPLMWHIPFRQYDERMNGGAVLRESGRILVSIPDALLTPEQAEGLALRLLAAAHESRRRGPLSDDVYHDFTPDSPR